MPRASWRRAGARLTMPTLLGLLLVMLLGLLLGLLLVMLLGLLLVMLGLLLAQVALELPISVLSQWMELLLAELNEVPKVEITRDSYRMLLYYNSYL